MERQFSYQKKDGEWSRTVGYAEVMGAAALRVLAGLGPYQLTQDGEPLGGDRTRVEVLRALRRHLEIGDIGPVYRIRHQEGVVFAVREVKAALDIVNTSGNDKADVLWSTIVAQFKDYEPRFAGAYVCKTISGSNQLSQHSYGNALDIFFNSFAHQEAVANWVVAHADELHIDHVISGRRIWTRGLGWHIYSGDFHAHLHVDFTPSYSGACGVRP